MLKTQKWQNKFQNGPKAIPYLFEAKLIVDPPDKPTIVEI